MEDVRNRGQQILADFNRRCIVPAQAVHVFPDMRTVFLVCCIANLVPSLGLLLVHATNRTYPGFRQWAMASSTAFVSLLLLANLNLLPERLGIILINLTFFGYPLLLARGFRAFAGRPPQNWIALLVLPAVAAIAIFFTYVRPDANTRVFLLSSVLVLLFFDCARLVRSVRLFAHPAIKASLIGTFGLLVLWNLLRVPLTVGLPGWSAAQLAPPLVQAITLILTTAANIGISLNVILLNFAQVSASLRESEERFRNLANAAFEGIAICENGRIVEVNEQALRMLGYLRAELIGREIVSLTAPPGMAPGPTGRETAGEQMLVRKDGSSFPAEAQSKTISLGGRPVQITALRDLTERRRMKEALEASEDRFRSAMQSSPIGMALVGLDCRWLEVNPALCQIVGYTPEELLRTDFLSITHPEDRAASLEMVDRLVARQVPRDQREKRYLHKNGRAIWVQVDVSLVFNPDGTPRHFVSQVMDVSGRKQTEQALHEYQARLMMAMDTARLGHWELDIATGRFTFDENFYKLLGTSAAREGGFVMSAEEYGRRFIPPEEAAVVAEEIGRALAATDPNFKRQLEHHFRRVDGTTGVMSVRFAIEKDAKGRTTRTFGLNQDITEQTEAAHQHRILEEQSRHKQKMEALGTLAGGIAHDFNNILTGILGNLQLAELDLPGDHPAQAKLLEASRASRRARDHVARILAFSRRYPGARAMVSLGPIVQEAVQLLRASLPATISIATNIDRDCPPVVCDATQIHQLVMNLGTNSAHAMRNGPGTLTVELKAVSPGPRLLEQFPQVKATHRVQLTISDTGSGMEKAVLARIFEPFFTTKPSGEGTGLGLAMVHGIMEDHEGAIVVTSTVGRGTTFDLYFPSAPDSSGKRATAGPFPATVFAAPFGQGRKIMLVDDDEAVLGVARTVLARFGFVPVPFLNASAALESFAAAPHDYAAVISDLTMPGMTGIELSRRFQTLRRGVPFILASGYLPADVHESAQDSGVTHYVNKPFDLEEFVAKIRAALEPPE